MGNFKTKDSLENALMRSLKQSSSAAFNQVNVKTGPVATLVRNKSSSARVEIDLRLCIASNHEESKGRVKDTVEVSQPCIVRSKLFQDVWFRRLFIMKSQRYSEFGMHEETNLVELLTMQYTPLI